MSRSRGPKLRFWSCIVDADGETQFEHEHDGWAWPKERHWNYPGLPCSLWSGELVADQGDPTSMIDSNPEWDDFWEKWYDGAKP